MLSTIEKIKENIEYILCNVFYMHHNVKVDTYTNTYMCVRCGQLKTK